MTIVKNPKPKIRKAEIEDFDKVYPLLQKMNNACLSRDDWHRLFENHWQMEGFSPGIVLETEHEIVGYIGTIYSIQKLDGKEQIFCNLTTWIVQEDFRSHSFMMILSLVRNKNIVLTSFSSNNVTYEVYKKLGFKDGNKTKRLVYPWPSLCARQYTLLTDIQDIEQNLNSENRKVFDDHKAFGNTYILIQHKDQQCLLMAVRHKIIFKLYYASDRDFMCQHFKHFRNKLMLQYKVKKMQVDEHLLKGRFVWFSRRVNWGNPYQYKTTMESLPSPSPEYSEIFLLNM